MKAWKRKLSNGYHKVQIIPHLCSRNVQFFDMIM